VSPTYGPLLTCCDLGRVAADGFRSPPPYRWRDRFGREYRVCALHYAGLLALSRRLAEREAKRRAGILTAADSVGPRR
jgi:hypothetical protein